MTNFLKATQRKFQSKMELIHLHAQLNDELEKLHQLIIKIKEVSLAEYSHFEEERKAVMQSIKNINDNIQSKTKIRKIRSSL